MSKNNNLKLSQNMPKIKKPKPTIKEIYVPDPHLRLPKEDFRETFHWRIFRIIAEFVEGFQFIADFKKTVAVFGSSACPRGSHHYKEAQKMGKILAKKGFSVVTGGGPGTMEAANKGALEAGGESIGINIQLPGGERRNSYLTKSTGFHYFFVRKVMLSFASSGYVFFPGGFGTLDEFFEMITMLQTRKMAHPIAVVAVGKDYWQPLFDWIEKTVYKKHKAIDKSHLKLFYLVDTAEEALKIIAKVNGLK